MFNELSDVLTILSVYVGLTRFGWQVTVLAFFNLSLASLAVMLALDATIYFMHKTGLTWYCMINQRDFKLQDHQKSRIDLVIMLIFILLFSALGTLLTKLILLDLV